METGGPWDSLASWSKQSKWYLKEYIRFPSGSDMLFVHMNIHKKPESQPDWDFSLQEDSIEPEPRCCFSVSESDV